MGLRALTVVGVNFHGVVNCLLVVWIISYLAQVFAIGLKAPTVVGVNFHGVNCLLVVWIISFLAQVFESPDCCGSEFSWGGELSACSVDNLIFGLLTVHNSFLERAMRSVKDTFSVNKSGREILSSCTCGYLCRREVEAGGLLLSQLFLVEQ